MAASQLDKVSRHSRVARLHVDIVPALIRSLRAGLAGGRPVL